MILKNNKNVLTVISHYLLRVISHYLLRIMIITRLDVKYKFELL